MEINKNQAQYQAKYQAEADNRGHWWIHKNQAEVNWQYPMVHR